MQNLWSKVKQSRGTYNLFLLVVMIALIILGSILSPYFLTVANFKNILNQSSIYIFLTIGMAFVIASGEIDLSVGVVIGFVGMVASDMLAAGINPAICLIAGLLTGLVIGLFNGWLVARFKINSFIVTLCTTTSLRGVILLIMNGKSNYGFGDLFAFVGSGQIGVSGALNVPIVLAIAAAVISDIVLRKTKFGNYSLFLGSNPLALHRAGVKTRKQTILVFALSGFLAAIAGIIVMGRLDSAQPLAGQGYEMDAIAAVILGGIGLEGGRGTIAGPCIACLILNIIKVGLTLMGVSTHYQEIITGIIIVVSVLISNKEQRKRSEV